MFILLKLHYAKFDLSSLFCSKVIKEKLLGGGVDPPPLIKDGLYFARPKPAEKHFVKSGTADKFLRKFRFQMLRGLNACLNVIFYMIIQFSA